MGRGRARDAPGPIPDSTNRSRGAGNHPAADDVPAAERREQRQPERDHTTLHALARGVGRCGQRVEVCGRAGAALRGAVREDTGLALLVERRHDRVVATERRRRLVAGRDELRRALAVQATGTVDDLYVATASLLQPSSDLAAAGCRVVDAVGQLTRTRCGL